jgi:hypothetical protein
LLEGAVIVSRSGEQGDFDLRCHAAAALWRCRVSGAVGLQANREIEASEAQLAQAIADVVARAVALEALAGLENEASRIRLDVRKSGDDTPRERTIGTRSVIMNASVEPEILHFYQRGSPRTPSNSLQLEIETSRSCYLTIVEVDARGSAFVLFPNSIQRPAFHPSGRIEPGSTVRIPDALEPGNQAGFYFDFGPPAGTETFYVYCMERLDDAQRLRASLGGIQTRSTHPIDSALGLRSAAIGLSGLYATRGVILEASDGPASTAASAASGSSDGAIPSDRLTGDWSAVSITFEIGP